MPAPRRVHEADEGDRAAGGDRAQDAASPVRDQPAGSERGPLIRNELMGHLPAGEARGKGPLGMTGVYTHASPATVRCQLEGALVERAAMEVLRRWLEARQPAPAQLEQAVA